MTDPIECNITVQKFQNNIPFTNSIFQEEEVEAKKAKTTNGSSNGAAKDAEAANGDAVEAMLKLA